MAAPLLLATPAMASVSSNKVDMQAVTHLTQSVERSIYAYHALHNHDVVSAKSDIVKAVDHLNRATAKDPALGLGSKSAPEFKREMLTLKSSMADMDRDQLRTELRQVLTSAGVELRSE